MDIKDFLLIILPPISALGGVALSEYLIGWRENRSLFIKEIMQRKIKLYEEIYNQLFDIHSEFYKASELIKNLRPETKRERSKILSNYVSKTLILADYFDRNRLYLDRELTDHILLLNLLPAELLSFNHKNKRFLVNIKGVEKKYAKEFETALDLLLGYSGIERINKSLIHVNKPRNKSVYSKFMKETREKYS